MDTLTKEQRSEVMSRIRSQDTSPEVTVRRWLWARGFRYRKNVKRLPGNPDIVFCKLKTAVFVHGCFWHRHPNCKVATMPKTNSKFWWRKFDKNVTRDIENEKRLRAKGWTVIVLWECEINGEALQRLAEMLEMQRTRFLVKNRSVRYDEIIETEAISLAAEEPLEYGEPHIP